jgi:hypothetical protein
MVSVVVITTTPKGKGTASSADESKDLPQRSLEA